MRQGCTGLNSTGCTAKLKRSPLNHLMAAATIARLQQWVKSPDFRSYLMSTHFWVKYAFLMLIMQGPVSNFGIPIAAVMDLNKDPEMISGRMTCGWRHICYLITALMIYSGTFMRYAMAVTPKNYLLLGCHIINGTAQSVQLGRFINHFHIVGNKSKLPPTAT